ncbi:MAG: glycosyl transferase-like UDP-glucuronosyltransferase [Sphingomonadaceae bacterium]|nr:glycosyl transferase-like UDP-glucuronosyltransferase [Sphingomonadaceae bacterium]
MARVLIGWELGAHSGHVRRILSIAEMLTRAGHAVSLALQRIDAGGAGTRGFPLFQAPIWPRLIASIAGTSTIRTHSEADILARLGLDIPGTLSALIAGWDAIFAAARPDVVIAEYAPALLCAAAARIPSVGIGTAFELPPATMPRFPSLADKPAVTDEAALLALTNGELARAGRKPLAALPAIFACDAPIVSAFAAFDPYAQWRETTLVPPQLPLPIPFAAEPRGPEAFVYWPENFAAAGKLWDALATSGLPIRLHAPSLLAAQSNRLAAAGLVIEPNPLPFAAIVARSRIIVSHGGAGITSSALVAGLPHVVVPIDLEKSVQALGVTRLGAGGWSPPRSIVPERFGADLKALAHDPALAARCRAEAERLRPLLGRDCADHTLDAVERLLSADRATSNEPRP